MCVSHNHHIASPCSSWRVLSRADSCCSAADLQKSESYGLHSTMAILQVTTWEVPYLFAWRKVYVDDNNTVVESPEDEWDDESWIGEGAGAL